MAPSEKKSLKEVAQDSNPSQLGDPVSLKAETSNTVYMTNLPSNAINSPFKEPTEHDRGAKNDGKSLKQIAEEKMKTNPTQLGDPVSLKAETSDTEPTNDDRGARGPTKSSGKPKM